MPSSVTITLYLGSGMEGIAREEKIQARCRLEKMSVSEWVVKLIDRELIERELRGNK